MSRHCVVLVALATMFTAGITSAALAWCEWGGPAPIAYQWGDWGGGCGGCEPVATYAGPVVPPLVAPAVGWGGSCGSAPAAVAVDSTPRPPSSRRRLRWRRCMSSTRVPTIPARASWSRTVSTGQMPLLHRRRRTPTWPATYSYVAGDAYPARYRMNPCYAGAGPVIPYRERAYYHRPYPRYAGPVGLYHPYPRYPHRPISARY